MTRDEKKHLYWAGTLAGMGEVALVFVVLHIWYGGTLPETPLGAVLLMTAVGLFSVWYGVKVRHRYLDKKPDDENETA